VTRVDVAAALATDRSSLPVRAVLFDLDDTLFPQADWLDGAWQAVAEEARAQGVDPQRLDAELRQVASQGSARGLIIDRALARLGRDDVDVAPLVARFAAHAPARLDPYPGVPDALEGLARSVPLGLVTDGNPDIQRAKLAALGLAGMFSAVVLSDELGREHRKPSPVPFRAALSALGVGADEVLHVGDRPDKDVGGAAAAGIRAVRVRTGEYASLRDDPEPWASVPDAVAAIELVSGLLA
jgi:putative hydrolase of the HAD superfamily